MQKKPPLILILIGSVTLIAVPLVFFVFGWRTLDLSCQRSPNGAQCQVVEHFAAGLYTRHLNVSGVNDLAYQTRRDHHVGHHTLTSTVVFETTSGDVPVSEISSNTDDAAKRQLIQTFREWKSGNRTALQHHADFINLFGWLGAIGTAFWAYVLLTWPYYWLKGRRAGKTAT